MRDAVIVAAVWTPISKCNGGLAGVKTMCEGGGTANATSYERLG